MRRLRPILLVSLGLAVGAVVVEAGFRVRDHGAFPHLNVYVPDGALGVRLRPGAHERISFSGNPVSDVRINQSGYRGADWPARQEGEIFVVGDSQAFGLGVEESQSFASRLGVALQRPVADAAVPTYGPDEYEAVLREELSRRKPKTVVYTVNLANDLFEIAHPNSQRHAVWDGWAVRKETAPAHVTDFPGRALLFRDSHAVFALRGLWLRAAGSEGTGSVASEGSWDELSQSGSTEQTQRSLRSTADDVDRAARDAKYAVLVAERKKLDEQLNKAVLDTLGRTEELDAGIGTLRAAHAQPGDIVRVEYGEGSRPVPAIAEQIRAAAAVRERFAATLRTNNDKATLALLARQDTVEQELHALVWPDAKPAEARSPLRPHLERVAKLCKENGAELVVLVLPLDVQVDAREWAKYHATPIDLSASRVLVEDIVAVGADLGVRVVDAWPALAHAEPGAFLDGDLHMTPKGHQAVADAIARELAHPARPRLVASSLPIGRSAVPTPDELAHAPAMPQDFSSFVGDLRRAGCKAALVREWLRISCTKAQIVVTSPGRAEPMTLNTADGSSVVAALLEGDAFKLRFVATDHPAALTAAWALGDESPEIYVYPAAKKAAELVVPPTAAENSLCACWKSQGHADCSELYGAADNGCATYGQDCSSMLACARGDASSPPLCLSGDVPLGATRRCGHATAQAQK